MDRQYLAPSSWAPYLINGDASGMEPEEQASADAFVARIAAVHGHGCFCDATDAGFVVYHDARNEAPFAADCQLYTLLTVV